MKKWIALTLALVMCLSLCACGGGDKGEGDKAESPIQIVGVYQGEWAATDFYYYQYSGAQGMDGKKDLVVVFDYVGGKELSLPVTEFKDNTNTINQDVTNDAVTLSINGGDAYAIFDPYASPSHYGRNLDRYSPYSYPLTVGTIKADADPVRMFAIFYVDPADISDNMKLTLTVGGESAECEMSAEEIAVPDLIMQCEENFEEVQMLASLPWRLDHVYSHMLFLSKHPGGWGDSYKSFAKNFIEPFDSKGTSGVLISYDPDLGTPSNPEYLSDLVPAWDLEALQAAYPDIAEDIELFSNFSRLIGNQIVDSYISDSKIVESFEKTEGYYNTVMEYLNFEPYAE